MSKGSSKELPLLELQSASQLRVLDVRGRATFTQCGIGLAGALAIVSFQVTPADHVAVFDEGTAGIRIAKCTPCKASLPRKFQKLNSLEYEKPPGGG